MNFKKNGGFTLVELIVVIAILGILAGIGIPQYSKYVEKAQIAVDEQNIVMLHNAFVVACVGNDVDPASVTVLPAHIDWDDSTKTFLGLNNVQRAGKDPIVEDFNAYIGEGVQFKQYGPADIAEGMMDPEMVGAATGDYKGNTIKVPAGAVQAYQNSNWGSVAPDDVLSLVGSVTNLAGEIDNATFNAMLEDPKYNEACAKALGYSDVTAYQADIMKKIADYEATGATEAEVEAYSKKLVTNTAVLVAAQNAEKNSGSIMSVLTANGGKDAKQTIKNAMASDPASGLSQAALAYGLYSSYMMEKDPENFNFDQALNPLDVLNTMDDPEFQKYLTEGSGKTDLDGYVAALGTAGSNTGNGVGMDIVENGFAGNTDLENLMNEILGKK